MSTAGGNRSVPFHADQREQRYVVFHYWAPRPDGLWKPAPDPESLGFRKDTGMPCEQQVIYYYFQSTLRLPPTLLPESVHLWMDSVDDEARVWVNGHLTPYPKNGLHLGGRDYELGTFLHPGDNSILVMLGDWCYVAEAIGARFIGRDRHGLQVTGRLEGNASPALPQPPAPMKEEPPAASQEEQNPPPPQLRVLLQPPPAQKIPYADADDWLRSRRDPANSAHSITPLHLPLAPLWSFQGSVRDVRIWGDTLLALESSTLHALDLNTGEEKWSASPVLALGDVTPDGKVAAQYNSEAGVTGDATKNSSSPIKLLEVASSHELWTVELTALESPLAINHDLLYVCDMERGLVRIRLSDGSFLPTVTPLLEGWANSWDSTAFTESQILFERYPWLYALNLENPERGTKFYAGGGHPMVADEYVVATNDLYIEGYTFRREEKWLRPIWKSSHTYGSDRVLCWAPVGEHGATLQPRRDSVTNAESLALVEIPSGQSIWEDPGYTLETALAAGDQLVVQEIGQTSSSDASEGPPPARLGVRDARSGKILWEGPDFHGKPMAESRGYLIVAEEGRLICFH
jgi:hypothetical protein